MKLTTEQTIALGKAIPTDGMKEASGVLPPGKHEVDYVFRLTGSFKKGKDYDQKLVAKADAWGLLAVALSKLNSVTVESLTREYAELKADGKALADQIQQRADTAIRKIKASTSTRMNGKITGVDLDVTVYTEGQDITEKAEKKDIAEEGKTIA